MELSFILQISSLGFGIRKPFSSQIGRKKGKKYIQEMLFLFKKSKNLWCMKTFGGMGTKNILLLILLWDLKIPYYYDNWTTYALWQYYNGIKWLKKKLFVSTM